MFFFLLSSLGFAETSSCPWLSLWKSPPSVELDGERLTLAGSMEISLQTAKAQERFLHELELCRANGDVLQSYRTWMDDNQPQLKTMRFVSLGLGALGAGIGLSVWDTNPSIAKPTVVLGGATAAFATTTFWIDRPTPVIEQAFVESFARYLEQRHLDAMEWMEEILSQEQFCFAEGADKRGTLAKQRAACERSMYLVRNSSYPSMKGVYSETQIHEQLKTLKNESERLDLRERQDRALYYCNSKGRFVDAESAQLALTDILWLIEYSQSAGTSVPDACQRKVKAAQRLLE